MKKKITLVLPEPVWDFLRRVAKLAKVDVDTVVAVILASTIERERHAEKRNSRAK
jgi:fructose-1,6-bisphosphatase/sedoheptulose 1,7-bisphosphatase-like protein